MIKIRSICIFVLILVFVTTFSVNAAPNADIVDSTFNPQIQTTTFRSKSVKILFTLPDGKILASGTFNTYNGILVGGLIRLNADASLDTTFNNDLLEVGSSPNSIALQPDGKILLLTQATINLADGTTYTKTVIRLNADGTIDSSFNYSFTGDIFEMSLDTNGRILVSGFIQVTENGAVVNKDIIRLKENGAIDPSFNAPPMSHCIERFTTQNNKILYTCYDFTAQQARLFRLNEDGTKDTSFTTTLVGNFQILEMKAQGDSKILILSDNRITRVNENGGADPDFQITTNFSPGQPRKLLLHSDGRITIAYSSASLNGIRVVRLLPNGTSDPSFTPYLYQNPNFIGYTILQDGSILIGDEGTNSSSNRFIRLLPNGTLDASFNPGGTGFQNINPGKIGAINILADEKILIGGDFDLVNNIDRKRIARLKPDSSLDTAFQINTVATGNYFSKIDDVYHFAVQNDGKTIVSGNFEYFVNGVQKQNLVRLNSDGSIDPVFNLSLHINDNYGSSRLGKNKPILRSDGKILVGTTRIVLNDPVVTPLLLTTTGSKDSSFNQTLFNTKNSVVIFDIAIQPDGKILLAGRHVSGPYNASLQRGYIVRLNSDGTVDQSFQAAELVFSQD